MTKLINDYDFGHSLKQLNLHTFNTKEFHLYEELKQKISKICFQEFGNIV